MAEYIEREAAIKAIINCESGISYDFNKGLIVATNVLDDIPAADVAPVVRNEKKILDVTCGDKTIWFQKNELHTIYCDKRREEWEGDFGKVLRADGKQKHRHLVINPDVLCDFTDLPFENCTFSLVVFDPPHIENLSAGAWMRKAYGSLDGDWKPMIRKGFEECMRVLKPDGVLVFKWSDVSISTREILNVIGQEPLFGHRSGKKMNTHWMCFMKFDDCPNCGAKMDEEVDDGL